MLGKISLWIVTVSFLAFVIFFILGNSIFFDSLRIEPEQIVGTPLSKEFEVEQSLKTKEGLILKTIYRKENLRIHFIKGVELNTSTLPEMIKIAKRYRVSGGERPPFLIRYLAAQVDPRRLELKQEVEISESGSSNHLLVTAQDDKWFSLSLFPEKNVLVITQNPSAEIEPESLLRTLKTLKLINEEVIQ